MSLFGEESYEDQEPPSLQLGPVWAPSWLPPSSPPASPTHHAPNTHQQSSIAQSEDEQPTFSSQSGLNTHQQASSHTAGLPDSSLNFSAISAASLPSAAPVAVAAYPQGHWWAGNTQGRHAVPNEVVENASDFGSFTAGSPTGFPVNTIPGQQPDATHASTHASASDSTWVPSKRTLSDAALSNASDSPHAYARASSALRPAAAAARMSVLQSMNRSVPISLDALGAEEVADPDIQLPGQPAAISFLFPPTHPTAAATLPPSAVVFQSAEPDIGLAAQQVDTDFAPLSASDEQQLAPDWHDTSFQGADSAFPADFQTAAPGFSATWPSSEGNSHLLAGDQRHAVSGPVVFEAFTTATQGQLIPGTFGSQL